VRNDAGVAEGIVDVTYADIAWDHSELERVIQESA
jgi:hypothetical protein